MVAALTDHRRPALTVSRRKQSGKLQRIPLGSSRWRRLDDVR
jgi:hypothetical protein